VTSESLQRGQPTAEDQTEEASPLTITLQPPLHILFVSKKNIIGFNFEGHELPDHDTVLVHIANQHSWLKTL